MILLVAMIGAIILSLDHHRQIKRQDLYSQISTKSTISLIEPISLGPLPSGPKPPSARQRERRQ
jgi:hypothetical protein